MKKNNHSFIFLLALTVSVTGIAGCKKNFDNPNAATQEQVLNSAKGLTGTAIGLQRIYSLGLTSNIYNLNTAVGFSTNEVTLRNSGNIPELQLSTGGTSVDGTNAVLANLWITSNKIIYDANTVIEKAGSLSDKGYASGLIGYTSIWKALALGSISMTWEKIPDTIGVNVTFSDRVQGFNRAVAIIDGALSVINANPISAAFANDISTTGVNVVNTLYALKARYLLFAGNYDAAMAAANQVDLTVKSTFNYEAINPNTIYQAVTSTNNIYQPVDSTLGLPVGLQPDLADMRIPFYTAINTTILPKYRFNGFWNATTTPVPIYLTDEINLIKAECYVRQSAPDLTAAKAIIDVILKQTPAQDPFGVGANIAAGYTGTVDAPSLLTEIYRNRCIELFFSGLKLEDMRRFERPDTERKRNFFPYPFRERDGNTNTPADPAF
ncbi:MAG: RagB/SusD family protein [Ferruginibacter sp.]